MTSGFRSFKVGEMAVGGHFLGTTVRIGWESALDLALPRPCPGCGGPGPWCAACGSTLLGRPRRVALPEPPAVSAVSADSAVSAVWALARYAGPARAAILAGKEHGRRDLPPVLGDALGRALLRLRRSVPLPAGTWLVPAPSRRAAARSRGGDPVTAMARAAARHAAARGEPIGVAPCLFTAGRARDSVGLDAAARAANLADRVRLRASGLPPAGADVLLIDDVLTSGATCLAAHRVLIGAGLRVHGMLVVATVPRWVSTR